MSKKFLFLTAIFITFIFSCTTPKKETGLIGIWESYEDNLHNKIIVTFYEDSVITELSGGEHRTNSNWTIDSSKVYFSDIKLLDTILPDVTYNYILNETKDSLDLKFSQKGERISVLFKKVTTNIFHDKH